MNKISEQEYDKIFFIVYRERHRLAPNKPFSLISYNLLLDCINRNTLCHAPISIGSIDFSMSPPKNTQNKSIKLENFRLFNEIIKFGRFFRMEFILRTYE